MARAEKDSGATVESLLASVRAVHFAHTSGFREGYDLGEVDTFLGALEVALGRRSPVGRLIASVEFTPVRMRKGYDTSEVDAFLAELDERAATLSRATSERAAVSESSPTDEAIELVQHARFTTVRRLGYKIDQVDVLLDELVEALQTGSALQEVLDRRPPSRTLAGEGYAVNEVEKLLSSLGLHRPRFASTAPDPDPPSTRHRSVAGSAYEEVEEASAEPTAEPAGSHPPSAELAEDDHPAEEHRTTAVLDDFLTHTPPRRPRKTGTGGRRRRRGERQEPAPESAPEPAEELNPEPTVEAPVEAPMEATVEVTVEPSPEPTVELPVEPVPAPTTAVRSFEVTLHAVDPVALSAFWCEVLGYRADPADGEGGAGDTERAVAVPKTGDGPRLTFARVPRRRGGLVRVRLDVLVAPELTGDEHAAAVADEAARLVALGATTVQRQDVAGEQPSGAVGLRDPEGNEFLLL